MKKLFLTAFLALLFSLSLVFPCFAWSYGTTVNQNAPEMHSYWYDIPVNIYSVDGVLVSTSTPADMKWNVYFSCFHYNNQVRLIMRFFDTCTINGVTYSVNWDSPPVVKNKSVSASGVNQYYNYTLPKLGVGNTNYATDYGNIYITQLNKVNLAHNFTLVVPVKNGTCPFPDESDAISINNKSSLYSGWFYWLYYYIQSDVAFNWGDPVYIASKYFPDSIDLTLDVSSAKFYNDESLYYHMNVNNKLDDIVNGTEEQNSQADTSRVNTDNAIDKITDAGNALDSYVPADINANDYTFTAITQGIDVNTGLSVFTDILSQPFVLQICLVIFSLMLIGFIFFGER